MEKGIDVSSFQSGLTDYGDAEFVLIKLTEGVGYKDPWAEQHILRCQALGLDFGFYHFARPDLGNSADQEASWFNSIRQHDVPFFVDVELGTGDLTQWTRDWLRVARTRTRHGGYYTYASFLTEHYYGVQLPDVPLWLAWYNIELPPSLDVTVWQWTNSHKVSGQAVDADRMVKGLFKDIGLHGTRYYKLTRAMHFRAKPHVSAVQGALLPAGTRVAELPTTVVSQDWLYCRTGGDVIGWLLRSNVVAD